MKFSKIYIFLLSIFLLTNCITANQKLFTEPNDPLREFVLYGSEYGKIAIIPVNGVISDTPVKDVFSKEPSVVQEFISHLRLAEKDSEVKAIVLKIDSPGGTITASDIIYQELRAFKRRSNKKVIAVMMNIATSGGYYIALPADHILAHPTTITGSIGAIFMHPNATELFSKIGINMLVSKSGADKDIGSPYREPSKREKELLQKLVSSMGNRFVNLVVKHRKLNVKITNNIATAKIYLANDALKLKLIDSIGYLPDAINKTRKMSGLSQNSKIVIYRRTFYPDDNMYNILSQSNSVSGKTLINLGLPGSINNYKTGFYYLWSPMVNSNK